MTLSNDPKDDAKEVVAWSTFLRSYAPGSSAVVPDLYEPSSNPHVRVLNYPMLRLWCQKCEGERNFEIDFKLMARSAPYDRELRDALDAIRRQHLGVVSEYHNLLYVCRDCHGSLKVYAVAIKAEQTGSGIVIKVGEFPLYDEPLQSNLWKLIGPARDLMLKGRRCEKQGLGIAAFSYYRRIVEDNKTRILEKYIDAAKKLEAAPDVIRQLDSAKDDQQFRKAIESVTSALPKILIFDGSNPLLLLHQMTSIGLHGLSDTECLEYAHDVRTLLAELARRIDEALQDRQEVHAAVMRLSSAVVKINTKKSP